MLLHLHQGQAIREYQALLVRKSSPGCFYMCAHKDITSIVMCPDVPENSNASLRIDNLSDSTFKINFNKCASVQHSCSHRLETG